MGLVSLLFSFRGRIGRQQYWLGCVALGLVGLFTVVMLGVQAKQALILAKTNPAAIAGAAAMWLLAAPVWAVMGWAGYALQVKRFHDRGRTGYLSLIPVVLIFFVVFTIVTRIAEGAPAAVLGAELMPVLGLLWLVNLAFFVDLGCLPGVEGPNKYGQPPGAPPSSPQAPNPTKAAPSNAPVTAALYGAQAAIERAIAEQARRGGDTKPSPLIAAGPSSSFGRRPAQ